VIGGGDIYAQALDVADRIYLTQVHAEVDADAFFPELRQNEWIERESSYQPSDEKNEYPCTFRLLEKKPA
jgi:dihydrofolate reductase